MIRDPGLSREEVLRQLGEQAIRLGEKALAERDALRASLHDEFIVCGAAGYPDPVRFDTLDEAQSFALDHGFYHVTRTKAEVTIRHRLVSERQVVWTSP